MEFHFPILLIITLIINPIITTHCLPKTLHTLSKGSSLLFPNDVLVSPNGAFTAGFIHVGENAIVFGIWFTNSVSKTVFWIANRDYPINGKRSKLELTKHGSLNLIDGGISTIWSANAVSCINCCNVFCDLSEQNDTDNVQLQLLDSGNLVLSNPSIIWQSFDSPTSTLLPNQLLTREPGLTSSFSLTNYSSGYYKLYFDKDNLLHLLYIGAEVSSLYWPDRLIVPWKLNRDSNNDTKVAGFDSLGSFKSSDLFEFFAADYGSSLLRRLTLDFDGNLRMYSLKQNGVWEVTWQAFQDPCTVHGLCGPNNLCIYDPGLGRKCSCLPGFRLKDHSDWSKGCEPEFDVEDKDDGFKFIEFPGVEFYGTLYLKVPRNFDASNISTNPSKLDCSKKATMIKLKREYPNNKSNLDNILKFLVWFLGGVGIVEVILIALVFCFVCKKPYETMQEYALAIGFRKFSYKELKLATSNFKNELVIGRGGSGVVYKGDLGNGRVAAIKKLNDAIQGEEEFLAEVNTIGRLNHMNLIETWGYCAERKHRLLVFEFMENRSLAEKLSSKPSLDWGKRYTIAFGAARGLPYLHEECLEWVLHCDVKPQNILLDANYHPKVADFGLSKLLNINNQPSFSQMRGTRGYMAPQWVTNEPITSKVYVYSYGVVMLEIVTDKSARKMDVVSWARKTRKEAKAIESWIGEIADNRLEGKYKEEEMKTLALMTLQCVEDDKDVRPTMSQVVEMLI